MEDIILIGYGGHAKSVADCIERQGKYRIAGYTDRKPSESRYPYLGSDDVLPEIYASGIYNAVVCIGYLGKGSVREDLYRKLKSIGYTLPVIADPSAILSETAVIDEGVFIGKNAIINSEAQIGKMAIVNTQALVEHDCIVGAFSHIAVAAVVCGGVQIGDGCLVGANATIIQGIQLGNHVIVGAGTVIYRDLNSGVLACGKRELLGGSNEGIVLEDRKWEKY